MPGSSARTRITSCPMSTLLASADLLKQPLATAEFLAVDTDTGQVVTYEQMLNCEHEFAPDVDKLVEANKVAKDRVPTGRPLAFHMLPPLASGLRRSSC